MSTQHYTATQHNLPQDSPNLAEFGLKFFAGNTHISRTIMLQELDALFQAMPRGSNAADYRDAICVRNILGKTTVSTRQKSLRHLRELYVLDENVPIFRLLRRLYDLDPASLPLLALQLAWARDPLFRATADAILELSDGDLLEQGAVAAAVEASFPNQYSDNSKGNVSRNTGSSWTQTGHLAGRAKKVRKLVKPSTTAVTMALFLGTVTGYHGAAVFSNPWCRLLDLTPERAKALALEAHRAGRLNLRVLGEVIDLSFPLFSDLQVSQS
jgi:hypothetical protein